MKFSKKLLSILLVTLLIFCVAPHGESEGITASAASNEGTFGADGDNLKWSFDSVTGELNITGSGAMEDYEDVMTPWDSFADSIKTVTIGNGVTTIGYNAFFYCSSLASITIPESVTDIGERAFANCDSLESITIPDSVTSIGGYAFSGCSKLSSIEIGSGVTIIDQYVFAGSGLESIKIPDSVKSIGESAFNNCPKLSSVEIGSGVTSIGYRVFGNCENLKSITIPDSVTSIGMYAFQYCTKLSSAEIGSGVTSIDYGAFGDCENLESITIPDSVISIGDVAFYNCTKLSSAEIGSGVTSIGSYAFGNCENLESITIPDSVTSIGEAAFVDCNRLAIISILNPQCTIYDSASTISYSNVLIHADENSKAKEYADRYGKTFQSEHKDDSGTVTKEPSCTEVGTRTYTCQWCGQIFKIEDVPATGHSMTKTDAKKETCETAGNEAYWYCSTCKKYFRDENGDVETTLDEVTINATGHKMSADRKVYMDSTCSQTGLLCHYCENCGKFDVQHDTVIIPLKEHLTALEPYEVIPATCTESEKLHYTCVNCGIEIVKEGRPAIGHNGVWKVTVVSCDKTVGKSELICERCNAVLEEKFGSTAEHQIVIDEPVAATCMSTGLTRGSHCSACGEIIEAQQITKMDTHRDYDYDGLCDYCHQPLSNQGVHDNCLCHKQGLIYQIIYPIAKIFWKIFKMNKVCACGKVHY